MSTSPDFPSILVTVVALLFLALMLAYRFFGKYLPLPRQLRVPPFKAGVFLLQDKKNQNKPERVVGPGTYWVTPKRDILICDTRSTSYKTQPEDFLTADNFGLRLSLTGQYRITDPVAFLTTSSNATGAFFLELTQGLRAATYELSGHNLSFARGTLPTRLQQLIVPQSARFGITLESVEVEQFVPLGWLKATLPQTPVPPTSSKGYGPN